MLWVGWVKRRDLHVAFHLLLANGASCLHKAVHLNHTGSKCLRKTAWCLLLPPLQASALGSPPHSPPALLPRCRGCFGDMDGLLQGSSQVHRPLLNHLPDVLDPVLLVLDAGCLCREDSHQVSVLPTTYRLASPAPQLSQLPKDLLYYQADDSNLTYFH